MNEDNTNEEQPTSSRKESQRINSGDDSYDEKKKYEERHDSYEDKRKYEDRRKYNDRGADAAVSNSESFTSSYSARSRMEVTEANANMPKPPNGKKDIRERGANGKKKRPRRPGKVQKRGRSMTRRRVLRKAPRRKPRTRKDRVPSVSTIFTRLSSESVSQLEMERGCNFCGHRCCRRRYLYEKRREMLRRLRLRTNLLKKMRRDINTKGMQAGSRSEMLSPLFINTNLPSPAEVPEATRTWCEITPEMIYETVKRLSMWRQYVLTTAILRYIALNFPVNTETMELQAELEEKLQVAAIADIIVQVSDDSWCLSCRLQNRYLTKNHVSRFWEAYGDTLRPIVRKIENKQVEDETENKAVPLNHLEQLINEEIV